MAYHDELLQQARELVHKNPNNPTQADLRRSVSSAYYALFHLLIFEACLNWSNDISRPGLASSPCQNPDFPREHDLSGFQRRVPERSGVSGGVS